MKIIATFQVSVHITGAYGQELVILAEVDVPESESYILNNPDRDEILLDRAKRKIMEYVKTGKLIARIVEKDRS